jgi:hypothetical protein
MSISSVPAGYSFDGVDRLEPQGSPALSKGGPFQQPRPSQAYVPRIPYTFGLIIRLIGISDQRIRAVKEMKLG